MLRVLQSLTLLSVLVCLVAGCINREAIVDKIPLVKGSSRYLPEDNAMPGLKRTSRVKIARGSDMKKLLGAGADLYTSYGATSLATADYTLGGKNKDISIENFVMQNEFKAAGLFNYFRGQRLRGRGKSLPIGVECVLDSRHDGRNLYFYKKSQFIKLIYSGAKPVPDLVPLASLIADSILGSVEKPKGFEYLDIPGIDPKTRYVTPGYTFNCDFLPTGIFAKAPEAGPIAEAFIINHYGEDEAKKTAQDYRIYLQMSGKNYKMEYRDRRRQVWRASQPDVGRVIVTRYKTFVIGVSRPKTFERGETVINKIIERIRRK